MLVRSRSRACGVCQKRKLKCDKVKPQCSQCLTDGWTCSGYLPAWKTVPRTAKAQPYEQQWLLRSRDESSTHLHRSSRDALTPPKLSSSFSDSSSILSKRLVYLLKDNTIPTNMRIQNLGSFLESVPPRLGYTQALDDAVQCICTAYASLVIHKTAGALQDRREYYKALQSLRNGILDEREALSSNILAAAVLLSWYEILADNLDEGWLAHIRGCGQLIRVRGPFRHQSIFDQELLDTQEGLVSGEALMRRAPSFLNSPAWCETLSGPGKPLGKDFFKSSLRESNERMASLSNLLRDYDIFIQAGISENATSIRLFQQFMGRRQEIREHIERIRSHTVNETCRNAMAIIEAKRALNLLIIDTSILRLLDFVDDDRSSIAHCNAPNPLEQYCLQSKYTFRTQLESEIDLVFEYFRHSILPARKATPFSTRKFAFMCRISSANRGLMPDQHPVWSRFGDVIHEVNRSWDF